MLIPDAEIKYCLGKATEIAEQYVIQHIAADNPERSTENLKSTCEKYLGGESKIQVLEIEVQADTSAVLGAYIKKSDTDFDICIARDLNYCWRRLVLAKELFHVILDKEEYRNMDLEAHVKEVTLAFPSMESEPGTDVDPISRTLYR
jgi:Zn-dependent peptidase ImmA (M78 family)